MVVGSLQRGLGTRESRGVFAVGLQTFRKRKYIQKKGRRFAECIENVLPADGMPEYLKCRCELAARNSFCGGSERGLGGKSAGKSLPFSTRQWNQ